MYVLLFGVPAFLAAIVISLLLFGAVAGALWLFVFGDNPWPSSAGNVPVALFLLVCMALWIAFISAAYIAGKRQEARAAINAWHLAASAGATALLVFGIAMHQWSVGNIGAWSSGRLCSEFCQCKGFPGSGMPPRDTGEETCSCYDARGGEAVKIPLVDITAQQCKFGHHGPVSSRDRGGVYGADGNGCVQASCAGKLKAWHARKISTGHLCHAVNSIATPPAADGANCQMPARTDRETG